MAQGVGGFLKSDTCSYIFLSRGRRLEVNRFLGSRYVRAHPNRPPGHLSKVTRGVYVGVTRKNEREA